MENDLMKKEEFIKNLSEASYYVGRELTDSELEYLESILPDEMDRWYFRDYYDLAHEINNEGLKDALHNFDLDDDITASDAEDKLDELYDEDKIDDTAYDYYNEKIEDLQNEGIDAGYKRFDYIVRDALRTYETNKRNKEEEE